VPAGSAVEIAAELIGPIRRQENRIMLFLDEFYHDLKRFRCVLFSPRLISYSFCGGFPPLKSAKKVGKKLTNNFIILCELQTNRASAYSHEVEALNDRQVSSVFYLSTKRCVMYRPSDLRRMRLLLATA
jgi:hypothetical protein